MKETPQEGAREDRYAPYVAAWKRRWQAEKEAVRQRRSQALSEAERAARLLAERYGAQKIVLFGSLAWGRFGAASDIDLAAWGLPPERFFRADADLCREIAFPIDLKLVDDCPPTLRRRITEDGVVLYEG